VRETTEAKRGREMRLWYVNGATGEIDSYNQEDTLTDFPRGVLLAYGDALVIGLQTKEAAEDWKKDWTCERTVNVGVFSRPSYRWIKNGERNERD